MERYLISSGYLILTNMFADNVLKYENMFFTMAEKFYESCMFEKADELALLCLSLCKEYQKKSLLSTVTDVFRLTSNKTSGKEENNSKAARFLKLYSRFRDASNVKEKEYQD